MVESNLIEIHRIPEIGFRHSTLFVVERSSIVVDHGNAYGSGCFSRPRRKFTSGTHHLSCSINCRVKGVADWGGDESDRVTDVGNNVGNLLKSREHHRWLAYCVRMPNVHL